MHPKDLPILGPIHAIPQDFIPSLTDIRGKKVLCIGFSESEIDNFVAQHGAADITALTYWAEHRDAEVFKYPLLIGDITKRTKFADGEFDAVISFSTLEHLTPLEEGLLEMKRITKHGGDVLAYFGPAWSCAYGHHMYQSGSGTHDDHFIFSNWKMPAFMHLLSTATEIADYYRSLGYSEALCRAPLHWFFEADHINRTMYDDYLHLFAKHFVIAKSETMWSDVPADILSLLRTRFPRNVDFSTYGGSYRLRVIK